MFERCAGATGGGGSISHYFERFGVDDAMFQRVLSKGLSRGGDFCEIYFEHTVNHTLMMQDGQINRAFSGVDLGAGVRVLKGDATGYAYCEDLSEPALLGAAETAAAVADSGSATRPRAVATSKVANYYPIQVPWSEVGVERKLPLVERVNSTARNRNPHLIKATIYLLDTGSHVMVVNSEGRHVEDYRPMITLYLIGVGMKDGRVETCYKALSAPIR